MNIQECDILNSIISFTYTNQRKLAETSGHSLGVVNRSIKNLSPHLSLVHSLNSLM